MYMQQKNPVNLEMLGLAGDVTRSGLMLTQHDDMQIEAHVLLTATTMNTSSNSLLYIASGYGRITL